LPELDGCGSEVPEADAIVHGLALPALSHVRTQLCGLLNRSLTLTRPRATLADLATAARSFGDEQTPVIGVVLPFHGDLSGHVLLLWSEAGARRVIRWCLPEGYGPDVEQSVLAEVGNVAGSAFVNAVADRLGLRVQVSPPMLAADMLGAILGSVLPLADLGEGRLLLVSTEFADEGASLQFLLAPDGPSLDRLIELAAVEGHPHVG
jgi:chemotaxis protein CheC